MKLIEKIKAEQLAARKAKNSTRAQVLTTLIGEADMIGKNADNRTPTDEEVVAILKKFIKNLDEVIRIAGDYRDSDRLDSAVGEKDILSEFLPQQLTEKELRGIIQTLVDSLENKSPKDMGKVLGSLKQTYAGMYDGALASKITKELLSNT